MGHLKRRIGALIPATSAVKVLPSTALIKALYEGDAKAFNDEAFRLLEEKHLQHPSQEFLLNFAGTSMPEGTPAGVDFSFCDITGCNWSRVTPEALRQITVRNAYFGELAGPRWDILFAKLPGPFQQQLREIYEIPHTIDAQHIR